MAHDDRLEAEAREFRCRKRRRTAPGDSVLLRDRVQHGLLRAGLVETRLAPDQSRPSCSAFAKIRIMSKTSDRINLTNQFLIAMPNMADPTFSGTVVYLCDHSERGALGLVINRPTDIDLQSLFNRIDLKLEIEPLRGPPVYFGGAGARE